MSKSRLGAIAKRLDRAAPTAGNGWTVGVRGGVMPAMEHIDYREAIAGLAPLPDDLVVVGDRVITTAEWDALEGDRILVVYETEAR